VSLDLEPDVERAVRERAAAEGATASEFIARLLKRRDAAPEPEADATEALFRQWDEEDAHMTDEERREEDRFWQEFARGINADRAAAGMRLIF
jgi:hypothetical protein